MPSTSESNQRRAWAGFHMVFAKKTYPFAKDPDPSRIEEDFSGSNPIRKE